MSKRITVPEEETLSGQVAQLAAEWREVGSDSSFLRMLSYRSELVPPFFDFYQQLRGDGLVSALRKLESYAKRIPLHNPNPAMNNLFIVEPFTGRTLTNLFASHPPTEKRVAALLS